jgi:hypothetical protein
MKVIQAGQRDDAGQSRAPGGRCGCCHLLLPQLGRLSLKRQQHWTAVVLVDLGVVSAGFPLSGPVFVIACVTSW